MHTFRPIQTAIGLVGVAALALPACNDDPGPAGQSAALIVVPACVDDPAGLSADAWLCPEDRVVECREHADPGATETLYVSPGEASCTDIDPTLDPGPYGLGDYEIQVTDGPLPAADSGAADAGTALCAASLRIVDTAPPLVEAHTVSLWPPNHRMEWITPERCVTVWDACDPTPEVTFTWVASDEAHDDIADGHHMPDVITDECGGIQVRAERRGDGDGRVYALGWRAVDASGNIAQGICEVGVPHDRSGTPATSGPAAYVVPVFERETCSEHADRDEQAEEADDDDLDADADEYSNERRLPGLAYD